MKRIIIALIILVSSLHISVQQAGYELFNFDWKFHHGDIPDAYKTTFND